MNDKPLQDYISAVITNPASNMRETLRYLRRGLDNRFDITDPSNPFIALMESSVQHSAAAVLGAEAELRKVFAIVANTPEDLYHHITDKSHFGVFALPAKAIFNFAFEENELRRKMVDDPANGYRKIVIPANTRVTVGGLHYRMPYAVEIRELAHKHLAAAYDIRVINPIHRMTSNVITPRYSSLPGTRFVSIPVEFLQYDVITYKETVTPSTSIRIERKIEQQYMHARVYLRKELGGKLYWSEIATTHSDYYYDPETPTAIVKVMGDVVQVYIPDYYVFRDMIVGQVRVDIYETAGQVNTSLGSFRPEDFQTTFAPIDKGDTTPYSEAIKLVSSVSVFSDSMVNGGRAALPFEELRARVIGNVVGERQQPISPDELETHLRDSNYEITKNIDNVTNRTFLASRKLPAPTYERLITAAALGVQRLSFTANRAIAAGNVIDNTTSITITPDNVFRLKNGLLDFFNQSDLNAVMALPVDARVLELNRLGLFYTPFHYVVDFNNPRDIDTRAYYLTNPYALNKNSIDENSSTMLVCTIGEGYELVRRNDQYVLRLVTSSNDAYKAFRDDELHAQIAFKPADSNHLVYANGRLVGRTEDRECVFEFDLTTSYYLDRQGNITLTNFTVTNNSARDFVCPLEHDFDLFFATSGVLGGSWRAKEIDGRLGSHLLPPLTAAISQERLRLHLGDDLRALWTQSRVVSSEENYERYQTDIADTYPENVVEVKVVNGQTTVVITHRKGDVRLNDQGEVIYKHRKGDVVYRDGAPVVVSPRKLTHQLDITLMEAAYRFSNDEVAEHYRHEVATLLAKWVVEDIEAMQPYLLEETRVFFHPQARSGLIPVIFDNARRTSIPASQSLVVNFYVDNAVKQDHDLQEQIKTKAIREINNYFLEPVIARGVLTRILGEMLKETVIDVSIEYLGGTSGDFKVLTLVSGTDRLSIGKVLQARPDGMILVVEDVVFNFIRHVPKPEEA